jgi:tetratricopeptide (TPR) repeat protein/predicted Ser/Thr protein kinase
MSVAPLTDDVVPRRIGRFEITGRLGSGGMGVVYLGVDVELDRKVAIKVLPDRRISDADRVRMQREAQALARLSHPNVVQVYEVGRHDEVLFVAMEHLDGRTLRAWLDAPRTWQESVEVLVQAGRGLAAAHRVGLIHRDFKPENAMFGGDGRVRVLDFGLARLDALHVDEESLSSDAAVSSGRALHVDVTRTGTTLGTPAYMAPEQFLGHEVDARTDQFAFCVALFEALYGRRPFEGRTRLQLAAAVTRGVIEVPADVRVPKRIRDAVLRGLSVEPGDRFADLETLVHAITRPSRGGRWLPAAVAVGGVAGAIAYGASREQVAACDDVASAIDADWGPTQREAIRAAFATIDAAYAADNLATLERELDAFADRWRAARVEACTATHVDGTQSGELMDQRMACLDGRRRGLAAVIALLSEGNADVLQRAVRAVDAIPDVERCGDPSYVRERVPRPDDPSSQSTIEHVEVELAAAKALNSTARLAEALARLEPIEEPARALGWDPLLARVLLELGLVRGNLDDRKGGDSATRDAFLVALRVDDSETAFQAARALAESIGKEQDRYDDAREWLDIAAALAARQDAAPWMAVVVGELRGDLLSDAGKVDEAIPILEAALRDGEKVLSEDEPILWNLHTALGKAYERRDRFDDARRQYELTMTLLRARLGDNHPQVARAHSSLGALASVEGRYEDALAHYQASDAIFAQLLPEQHPIRAGLAHNGGDALCKLGRFEEALPLQQRALESFVHTHGEDHANVAFALNNIGITLRRLGRIEDSLAVQERGLAIRRRIYPPDHPEIGLALGNLALLMQTLKRYEDARVYQEQALELAKKELGTDHTLVATQLQNLGSTLDSLDRDDEAEARFLEARAIWTRLAEEHPDAASAEQGLAYLYLEAGRLDEALAAIERAIVIRRVLGETHHDVGGDFHVLGRIQLARGEHDAAAAALRRALLAKPDGDEAPAQRIIARRRFDLARVLVEIPSGHAEARTLAESARTVFEAEHDAKTVAEIDVVLARLR